MRLALLLFILVPVIELSVLIAVGGEIGALATVGLVFLTAILGVAIIRTQGLDTLLRAQDKMRRGELPAVEVAEGFMLALAGLMLLIPGFVSDSLGAVLLITPLRRQVAQTLALDFLTKRMNMRSAWHHNHDGSGEGNATNVFDGEFTKDPEQAKKIDKK
jgi:UPF0716 protein FxsA